MFRASGPLEMRCVGETEFVQGVASMAASGAYGPCMIAAGISSTADLMLGAAVEPVLLSHKAAGANFCGIRAPFDPTSAAWREGMEVVQRMGLVYDIGCGTEQLDEVVEVAKAFPGVTMVLNHCGGTPGPGAFDGHPEVEAKWRAGIEALAACSNVYAKVGGIQMTYNGIKAHPLAVCSSAANLTEGRSHGVDKSGLVRA
jgi:predicted TIM-barrel fold metal-dependent hydrolase